MSNKREAIGYLVRYLYPHAHSFRKELEKQSGAVGAKKRKQQTRTVARVVRCGEFNCDSRAEKNGLCLRCYQKRYRYLAKSGARCETAGSQNPTT